MTKLNVKALIAACGGASVVASQTDVVRTAPYGWIRRNYMSSKVLEKLKAANPELRIDDYFNTE